MHWRETQLAAARQLIDCNARIELVARDVCQTCFHGTALAEVPGADGVYSGLGYALGREVRTGALSCLIAKASSGMLCNKASLCRFFLSGNTYF